MTKKPELSNRAYYAIMLPGPIVALVVGIILKLTVDPGFWIQGAIQLPICVVGWVVGVLTYRAWWRRKRFDKEIEAWLSS